MRKLFVMGIVITVAAFAVAASVILAQGKKELSLDANRGRSIEIRPPAEYGATEMPPAFFSHEKHVEELDDIECTGCHGIKEDGTFDYRLVDPGEYVSREMMTDAYHEYCISCHQQRMAGPQRCMDCHDSVSSYEPEKWRAPRLSDAQHQKHVEAREGRCEICHHEYEGYDPGSGFSSCRDCHDGTESGPTTPAMREVAHGGCIACHVKMFQRNEEGGPTECSACHPEESGW